MRYFSCHIHTMDTMASNTPTMFGALNAAFRR